VGSAGGSSVAAGPHAVKTIEKTSNIRKRVFIAFLVILSPPQGMVRFLPVPWRWCLLLVAWFSLVFSLLTSLYLRYVE
jgi:hypothetical protein